MNKNNKIDKKDGFESLFGSSIEAVKERQAGADKNESLSNIFRGGKESVITGTRKIINELLEKNSEGLKGVRIWVGREDIELFIEAISVAKIMNFDGNKISNSLKKINTENQINRIIMYKLSDWQNSRTNDMISLAIYTDFAVKPSSYKKEEKKVNELFALFDASLISMNPSGGFEPSLKLEWSVKKN